MKKNLIFIGIVLSLLTTPTPAQQSHIHLYNKILMRLYPRPFKFQYPEMPRILAREALLLYRRGEAFFIGCGYSTKPLPGGLYSRFCLRTFSLKWLKAISKYKILIVYWAWNDEGHSARVAHFWMKQGIKNIRVVFGGDACLSPLNHWTKRQYNNTHYRG